MMGADSNPVPMRRRWGLFQKILQMGIHNIFNYLIERLTARSISGNQKNFFSWTLSI
jgi:hypothetical protein